MNDKIITGSCLCGHIKYEYKGELGPSSYCHCEDCRKESGSAFNVVTRFEENKFSIVSGGKTNSYTKISDRGNQITRHFCPHCGSTIYSVPQQHPGYIWIRSGTLDDPNVVRPSHQSWIESKVVWSEIPKELKSFVKSSSMKQ